MLHVQNQKRRWLLRVTALALGVWGVLGIWAVFHWIAPWFLTLPSMEESPSASPVVTDRHGNRLLTHERIRHEPIPLEHIPQSLVAATLAAEDKRFFSHGGIDYLALCRALRDHALRCESRSGASTITQQLIKINRPPRQSQHSQPRNLRTKLQEMLLARQVEMRFSKERILEMYLNRLDYGSSTRGCAAASEHFFQKPPDALSLAECALLAGLPQAPSRLNPLRNPQAAKRRQLAVLSRLQAAKIFPEEAIASARSEPWALRSVFAQDLVAPHAVKMALQRHGNLECVRSRLPHALQTTLDGDLQRHVEAVLCREVASLASRNVQNAAAVVIDNGTGEILALAGSSDYASPQAGQINGALHPRSAGSTLKPFVYLLAFEKGAFPGTVVADVNARFPDGGGFFTPANYDRTYHGPVSLRDALANSYNAAAVRLLHQNGGAAALLETLRKMEFERLAIDPGFYGLGLAIGNAEVRLLDLANAYACIARMGEFRPWKLLLDERSGKWKVESGKLFSAASPHPIFDSPDSPDSPDSNRSEAATFHFPLSTFHSPPPRIFTAESCYLLADILSDNQARTPAFGSQSALRLPFRVAAKTGTSSDFRDNWCVLFTPQFTVAVWMGNHNATPMRGVSGVTGAANAANAIMARLAERTPPTWYARPPGILRAPIDKRTGRLVSDPLDFSRNLGIGRSPKIKSVGQRPTNTIPQTISPERAESIVPECQMSIFVECGGGTMDFALSGLQGFFIFRGALPLANDPRLSAFHRCFARSSFGPNSFQHSQPPQIDPQWLREEIFRHDAPPAPAQAEDYDEQGRAILSASVYAEWFRSPHNRFPEGIALPADEASIPPRILHPFPNRIYLLDPELPNNARRLPLESNLTTAAQWSSPTLPIDSTSSPPCALLVPGTHEITLKNTHSGVETRTQIRVEER